MTKNLLWKELREQWPALPLVLGLQALIHLGLGQRVEEADLAELWPRIWAGGAVFAAAVWGALFWAAEAEGSCFLFQLPISRRAVLGHKLAAAALQLGVFLGLSVGLYAVFMDGATPLPTSASAWVGGLAALAVAWSMGAWVSIRTGEPLWAIVAGAVPAGRSNDEPYRTSRRFGLSPSLWCEGRQKGGLVLAALGVPGVILASGLVVGGIVLGLWTALAGTLLGVQLYTGPERGGSDFFLHHLPIHRRALAARRWTTGLFGALLLTMELVLWPPAGGPADDRLLLIYLASFGLGALVSPWIENALWGVLLALATLVVVAISVPIAAWELDVPVIVVELALLAAVLAVGWWSSGHDRALEPGRSWRVLVWLTPFWLWFGWWVSSCSARRC